MKHNIIETIMGAVVVTIAALFIIFSYRLSHLQKKEETSYKASFDRIDGLVVGADVKISGVKVGSVKSAVVNGKTYLAEVVINVERHIKLPKDTSAEIVSEGLMGGKYIALVPGGDDLYMIANDEFPYTQSSVNLENLIGQMIFSNKNDQNDADKKKHNTTSAAVK